MFPSACDFICRGKSLPENHHTYTPERREHGKRVKFRPAFLPDRPASVSRGRPLGAGAGPPFVGKALSSVGSCLPFFRKTRSNRGAFISSAVAPKRERESLQIRLAVLSSAFPWLLYGSCLFIDSMFIKRKGTVPRGSGGRGKAPAAWDPGAGRSEAWR